MSVRTTFSLVLCLIAVAANVSCNQSGTAAGRREVAREKAASSEPAIQRRRPVDTSETLTKRDTLPEHGASPHFRVADGQQQDEDKSQPAAKPERELPPIFLSEQHKASCLLK
ncbi:MAG: hypothetical protein OES79_02225, partial [Planctomycetota bacterium]|nr:hypothetical protein [Planctomycetota bacterium]